MPTKTQKKTPEKKTEPTTGYTRVPVTDVWATDEEVAQKAPNQKYDWVAIGDKAVEGAKTHPDQWLLVGENVPSSVASNITAERIAALRGVRFVGWKFRGRMTDMSMTNPGRGKAWIKATRTRVNV